MRRLAVVALALVSSSNLWGQRPKFVDATERSGISGVVLSGSAEKNYVLEVNGGGVCWLDYDDDGLQDAFIVNGGTIEDLRRPPETDSSPHRLFRNRGDGTFENVAAALPRTVGWGFGCAVADYDNDGFVDLFVAGWGANLLLRNEAGERFVEVAAQAGVAGGEIWHAGAAFGDYDNDGFVDLYVAGYLDFDIQNPPDLGGCEYRGVKVRACGPLGYRGAPDALYRNQGDGTFRDVTAEAGVVDEKLYYGFTVVFEDFDDDGLPDLFVANDSNPSYLYRNLDGKRFEEVGATAGVAYSENGKEFSDMGVAVGDYDGDGLPDLFITTFADDNYALFRNDGGGFFTDVSYPSGLGEPTIPYLGWATMFFDADNDGDEDLFVVNGHVYPEVDGIEGQSYRQPSQWFENLGDGRFAEESERSGLTRLRPLPGRGGAAADFDNDGDVDVLISNIDEAPTLIENLGTASGDWLILDLRGSRSNARAVGARVRATAAGRTLHRGVRSGGSYLSSNDLRLHFGLGEAERADVEIRWPSGTVQRLESVRSNRIIRVVEPAAERPKDGPP